MTKESEKNLWEANYRDQTVSGIEIRDKNDRLVHFIAIKHKEVLKDDPPHRITIKLNENSEPILPAPQTFEEKIQAKRRQQMISYGPSSSSNQMLSIRSSRSIAASRRALAASSLTRRPVANLSRARPTSRRTKSSRSSRSSSSRRSRKKAKPAVRNAPDEGTSQTFDDSIPEADEQQQQQQTKTPEPVPNIPKKIARSPTQNSQNSQNSSSSIESNAGPSARVMVASLKDLKKSGSLITESLDPKEVKLMLKSAPPGSSIVLPNGCVIKKSRRGGARVGAGRKRSRPMSNGGDPKGERSSSMSADNSLSSPA